MRPGAARELWNGAMNSASALVASECTGTDRTAGGRGARSTSWPLPRHRGSDHKTLIHPRSLSKAATLVEEDPTPLQCAVSGRRRIAAAHRSGGPNRRSPSRHRERSGAWVPPVGSGLSRKRWAAFRAQKGGAQRAPTAWHGYQGRGEARRKSSCNRPCRKEKSPLRCRADDA